MATRKPKPDLSDLKSRLGLNDRLSKKPPAGAGKPAPGESTMVQPPPGARGPRPGRPPGGRPQGGPPGKAAGQLPPHLRPGNAPNPFQVPGQGGVPDGAPTQPPQQAPEPAPAAPKAPAFARKPPSAKPGKRKPKPKPKQAGDPDWQPPASDPGAAMDVPIREPRSIAKMAGLIVVVGGISMLFGTCGFVFGSGVQDRAIYNARTNDAKRALEAVQPKVEKIKKLKDQVAKINPLSPNPEDLKVMKDYSFVLEPEEIVGGNLLLGPERSQALMRFASDTKLLALQMKRHHSLTTRTDKKELEALAAENKDFQSAGFAVLFSGESFVGNYPTKKKKKKITGKDVPKGKLAVVEDPKPIEKDGELYYKVRYRNSGRSFEHPLKDMVAIQRADIVKSAGPNAIVRYKGRHEEISQRLQVISQYADSLVTQLEELSSRGGAPLLSVSSSE